MTGRVVCRGDGIASPPKADRNDGVEDSIKYEFTDVVGQHTKLEIRNPKSKTSLPAIAMVSIPINSSL